LDFLHNDRYFVPGKFQHDSDNSYIEKMKQTLPVEHYWSVLTPEDLMESLDFAMEARDLPGMADVDASLLCFCKDISTHVKVALSGECADEIFGGYPWFRDADIAVSRGFPWSQNTHRRAALLNPDFHMDCEAFVHSRYENTITQTDILPNRSPEEVRMKQMINLNYRWFMQTLLDRKDRMSSGLCLYTIVSGSNYVKKYNLCN
jgi:asparagine synthase (glutamine-hydrolysing)